MLNLSKTCHYALRALLHLAKNGEKSFIKIETIAKKEAIPPNFLSKILQVLIKKGMVDSMLGPKGGVRLAKGARFTTVLDVITAIDGKVDLKRCVLFGLDKCPELESCLIQEECRRGRLKIWDKLKKMRLANL